MVSGWPFRFYIGCRHVLSNQPIVALRDLPESRASSSEVRRILGSMSFDEFNDALRRVFDGQPLTKEQEPRRKFLEAHIKLYMKMDPDNPSAKN